MVPTVLDPWAMGVVVAMPMSKGSPIWVLDNFQQQPHSLLVWAGQDPAPTVSRDSPRRLCRVGGTMMPPLVGVYWAYITGVRP
jgi:hypothetical protein